MTKRNLNFSLSFNCFYLLKLPPIYEMKPLAAVGFTGIKDVTYWLIDFTLGG